MDDSQTTLSYETVPTVERDEPEAGLILLTVAAVLLPLTSCLTLAEPTIGLLTAIFSLVLLLIAWRQRRGVGEAQPKRRGLAGAAMLFAAAGMVTGFAAFLSMPHHHHHGPRCASNMRQITQGIILYAGENSGQLPPDLQTVRAYVPFPADVFVCPDGRATPATETQVLQVGVNCDYVYLVPSVPLAQTRPGLILIYEPVGHHGKLINVGLNDGSMQRLDEADSAALQTLLASPREDGITLDDIASAVRD